MCRDVSRCVMLFIVAPFFFLFFVSVSWGEHYAAGGGGGFVFVLMTNLFLSFTRLTSE